MTKITKMEKMAMVKAIVIKSESENKEMLINFLDAEMALLEKRKSTSKKNISNDILMDKVYKVLATYTEPITVSTLLENTNLATYEVDGEKLKMSSQKLSAILKKLVDSDFVKRTTEKRKAYFQAITK